jgi:glycosyltransferase involved in cell wall biosynthesis
LPASQHTALRIFFSSTLCTPFIEQDEIILSAHYRLEKIIASGVTALLRIPGAVGRADITLSWFGSVYAGYTVLLTKLLRKKSIIIVAGVDASKDKEINYGIWLSPWKSLVMRYAFRNADRLLVVDPFLQREAMRLAEYDGSNIVNIPFGFDGEEWKPGGTREDMVLTVAACDDTWRMKKKGIDKLFEAARSLPEVRFCLIGIRESLLPEITPTIPPNMTLIPYVPRSELLPYYQRAKVYCQPSFTEGLPNTLCEAMLSGCIPVGTIAGGIPTAIGTAGYLVEYRDQQALVDALQRALASPPSDGLKARERIAREFALQKREQALQHVIDGLCG